MIFLSAIFLINKFIGLILIIIKKINIILQTQGLGIYFIQFVSQKYNILKMEGSRLSKFGKETLKNRSNFHLLQEIDNQKDYEPIINHTTSFLDQNGQEILLNQKSTQYLEPKTNIIKEEQSQLYALPKKSFKEFNIENQPNEIQKQPISSKYEPKLSQQSGIISKKNSQMFQKKLLNPKKPARKKKSDWDPDFDIPGSDLNDIEDIIKDIGSVMQRNQRSMIIAPSKEKEETGKKFKGFKSGWNAKFNMMNKLDEMLLSYKTVGQEEQEENAPILDDFYRSKKKEEEDKGEKKMSSFIKKFEERKKPKNGNTRFSIMQIRWDQLPIIPAYWDSSIYLRLQSYPQQQQYLKIVKKSIENGVKSYSIFTCEDAGIFKGSSNDKNTSSWKLMSEQEYAKQWQSRLKNGEGMEQNQIEMLMQFDIQWYRAIIEYEYHAGLEDILEKNYDISTYASLLKEVKRNQNLTIETLIQNQISYLQQYFKKVYSSQTDEIMIGIIRLNTKNPSSQEIAEQFKTMFKGHTCILPFKKNQPESFLILAQLCGPSSSLDLQQNNEKLKVKMKKPAVNLLMGVEGEEIDEDMILLKEGQDNEWEVKMKVVGKENVAEEAKILVEEELLFGMLYVVDFD